MISLGLIFLFQLPIPLGPLGKGKMFHLFVLGDNLGIHHHSPAFLFVVSFPPHKNIHSSHYISVICQWCSAHYIKFYQFPIHFFFVLGFIIGPRCFHKLYADCCVSSNSCLKYNSSAILRLLTSIFLYCLYLQISSSLPFRTYVLYSLCFFFMHDFRLCVNHSLSLTLFRETLTNGKQALNLFLTINRKFVYQSASLVYNAPQFSDSIIFTNLLQFRSPNILVFGLSFITCALCDFKDTKQGKWSEMSQ